MFARTKNTPAKRIKMSLKILFPVFQACKVFPAKVNEDDEGAMDTIYKANEGGGKIACSYLEFFCLNSGNYGPE